PLLLFETCCFRETRLVRFVPQGQRVSRGEMFRSVSRGPLRREKWGLDVGKALTLRRTNVSLCVGARPWRAKVFPIFSGHARTLSAAWLTRVRARALPRDQREPAPLATRRRARPAPCPRASCPR